MNELMHTGFEGRGGDKLYSDNAKHFMKRVEQRLYAYPHVKARLARDMAMLKDYYAQKEDMHFEHSEEDLFVPFDKRVSKSILLANSDSSRVSKEEMEAMRLKELEYRIAVNRTEVNAIDQLFIDLSDDAYLWVIQCKYFDGLRDKDLANQMHYDPSTLRRNRTRLLKIMAIRLYGCEAI